MRTIIVSMMILFWSVCLYSQKAPPSTPEQFEKEYNKRIQKERLYGVYIPKDLADAFSQLNGLSPMESIQKFKIASEEIVSKKLHFSLGRWIIHNWGFRGGSRLSHHIKQLGIHHPDDQAQFLIISYHRYLNKLPLKVKEQVEHYQAMRKKMIEDRLKKGTVIHEEKRKRVGGE